jgi:Co/Zn/Cd efflux system component
VVEVAYGFLAGSLALLADAGHNLSDVLGLLRDSFNLALDAVPAGIDPEAVKTYLSELDHCNGSCQINH